MKNEKFHSLMILGVFFAGLVIILLPLFSGNYSIQSEELLAVPSTELPLSSGTLSLDSPEPCDCSK